MDQLDPQEKKDLLATTTTIMLAGDDNYSNDQSYCIKCKKQCDLIQ